MIGVAIQIEGYLRHLSFVEFHTVLLPLDTLEEEVWPGGELDTTGGPQSHLGRDGVSPFLALLPCHFNLVVYAWRVLDGKAPPFFPFADLPERGDELCFQLALFNAAATGHRSDGAADLFPVVGFVDNPLE